MRLLVELELWGLSSPVRLVSLFCFWCLRCVPVGSSTCGFMDGRGVGLLLRGCGLLCLSLFSNNPFNAVFMSRERVTARHRWVSASPRTDGGLIFLACFGFMFGFFARLAVTSGFSHLELVVGWSEPVSLLTV
ncbi:hypothetical protein F2Q69_00034414 [Brassica cretica]|uniref:Uncharacterized protein n=1 Tax=Brassica cretica TaxID=69181 RepID=A0A8S9SMH0_BRACR|nr:hypothetical protein F2Q69_00034414 [Brassica cretica]